VEVRDEQPSNKAWRALMDAEYGNMLNCIRCGQCLTSCPTYVLTAQEAEGPRGRIALGRAVTEGRLPLSVAVIQHEQSCLVCDACTAVCPAGVHMDPLQIRLRAAIEPVVRRPVWQRMVRHLTFRWLFASMVAFRLLVLLLALYQRLGAQRLARRTGLLRLLRLEATEALLPPLPLRFVAPRGEVYPADALPAPAAEASATPVAFFAGCVMSTALAEIDRATIRVLQRAGCAVANPAGQGCCGALHAHGGDLEGLRALARRNIAAFERAGEAPIIVNSAGCGAMLKGYAHEFARDPTWADRAAAFAARVQDVTEFLAPRPLPMRRALEAAVAYQDPCHLAHAQRIRQQPRALLTAIPGLTLKEMGEGALCCGSAGVYNVTHPTTARQLRERKLDHALATGATIIATANPGCLLQLRSGLIERGSDVAVKHVVELLDEASAP
jgi:glycolate oxidase iron-sulfur subunit